MNIYLTEAKVKPPVEERQSANDLRVLATSFEDANLKLILNGNQNLRIIGLLTDEHILGNNSRVIRYIL
jgi:hypothetical protein